MVTTVITFPAYVGQKYAELKMMCTIILMLFT